MRQEERLARNSETSEKAIERYLVRRTGELGFLCLKYTNPNATGYPDRIVLFPGRQVMWVEVKSKGKRPTAIQMERMKELAKKGHSVWVVDSREEVDRFLWHVDHLKTLL